MNAFSEDERSAIRPTDMVNGDKLYLLSLEEVTDPIYGFSSDEKKQDGGRVAQATSYAKRKGAWTSTVTEYAGTGRWWLRSPGSGDCSAARVYSYGSVDRYGNNVDSGMVAVRPVLHLNLAAKNWSYAGTVTARGGDNRTETAAPAETTTPNGTIAPGGTIAPDGTTAPGGVPTNPSGGSPFPLESKKPDGGLMIEPTSTPDRTSTESPAGTSTESPAGTSTESPDGISTESPAGTSTESPAGTSTASPDSPGTTTAVPAPALRPSAEPVKISVGKVFSVKLKQKKQKVMVSWKKISGADGYQVCWSTSKKWKNKTQKLTTDKRVNIKKLKKRKTYYFRIRACRIYGVQKVYGTWSKTKKIRIR